MIPRHAAHSQDMIRILLVEDNEDLAFAVASCLRYEGYEVVTAEDGPTGLFAAQESATDLVILDVMLPGFDGFRLLQELRGSGSEVPVLVLTSRSEEADKLLGFRAGADDYLTKPFGVSELVARVQALLRRSRLSAQPAAPKSAARRFGNLVVDWDARTVHRDGAEIVLRPRERELLFALASRPGHLFTREQLLRDVWQYEEGVTSRTIDIHLSSLRRKLEANPAKPAHIVTVLKAGYRFDP